MSQPLADTGERCLPWMADAQVVYEHLHRYYFAGGLVAGLDVLDVGCGEGYGAAILAESARSVLAVDIASHVVEHVREHDKLVAAAHRVLRPDGLFVISTPDRDRYNRTREPNPFHVRELSADELRRLLDGSFTEIAMWTQHLVLGSTLAATPERPGTVALTTVVRRGQGWERRSRDDDYLVAVASSRALPDVAAFSLLDDRGRSLVADAVEAAASRSEAGWREAVDGLEARWQKAADELAARLAQTTAESDVLRARAESAEAEVEQITRSRSWRALQRLGLTSR